MKHNHTPGPWYVQGSLISPTPTGKRFAIAEVFRDSVETAKANARLIALAPELAEALHRLTVVAERRDANLSDPVYVLDAKQDLQQAAREARAVLAKLEG